MNELPTGLKSAFIKKVSQGKSLSKEKYLGQNHLFCVKKCGFKQNTFFWKGNKSFTQKPIILFNLGFSL